MIVLLSGWAYPASALAPLSAGLGSLDRVEVRDAHAFDPSRDLGDAGPCALAGWSLGAILALQAALSHPGGVSRLILIGGTARYCAGYGYPCGQPAAAVRAMRARHARDPAAVLEEFHRACAAPATLDDGELRARVDASAAIPPAELRRGLDRLLDADLRAAAASVRQPVLLLHGDADRVTPIDSAEWLAARLPRAQLEIKAGNGHDLPVRDPLWIRDRVAAFLT